MAETAVAADEQQTEDRVEAPWEHAECTCPDWCERDHERD